MSVLDSMATGDHQRLTTQANIAPWRLALAQWVESGPIQSIIVAVIVFNAILLGLLATPLAANEQAAWWLHLGDQLCLAIFIIELVIKGLAYRLSMFKNGWNIFDTLVVAIALIPASGSASVLRGLRVLRLFRLFSAVPSLRRVVMAFLHALPGLGSVGLLMSFFLYIAAVMATGFFGQTHPEWFGHVGSSLFTLFQVMTLESWSMGIARPVMEAHPWAWAFFVPYIIFATFTILNLFIGIIVSTMQELGQPTDPTPPPQGTLELVERLEKDLAELRKRLDKSVG